LTTERLKSAILACLGQLFSDRNIHTGFNQLQHHNIMPDKKLTVHESDRYRNIDVSERSLLFVVQFWRDFPGIFCLPE
jgi:hypothetical protein